MHEERWKVLFLLRFPAVQGTRAGVSHLWGLSLSTQGQSVKGPTRHAGRRMNRGVCA